MKVEDLVVVPREPALGVARLERFLDVEGVPSARLLLYDTGKLVVRPVADVAPCPAGVWQRTPATKQA